MKEEALNVCHIYVHFYDKLLAVQLLQNIYIPTEYEKLSYKAEGCA